MAYSWGTQAYGSFLRSLLYLGSVPDDGLEREVIWSMCKSMKILVLSEIPPVKYKYPARHINW